VADYLAASARAVGREIAALDEMTPSAKAETFYDPALKQARRVMRKSLWTWAILFLWVPAAEAVPPAAPERAFTAHDLFDLEAASDPQISADGRWIAMSAARATS